LTTTQTFQPDLYWSSVDLTTQLMLIAKQRLQPLSPTWFAKPKIVRLQNENSHHRAYQILPKMDFTIISTTVQVLPIMFKLCG
jgi:hypothetical protein